MASKFKEILNLCENQGFLKVSLHGNITLKPIGYLLQENLKSEWINSNLINRDISVFLNIKNNLNESYQFVKELCQDRLPFGIVHITPDSKIQQCSKESNEVDLYFQTPYQIKLQSFMFVSPSTSTQYFHNWQRHRRIWWRKFSASPGRYSLTDIQISQTGQQNVEILSSYPWGTHTMEEIFLNPSGEISLTEEQLKTKDGRKTVQAHCIISTTFLSTMTLNTLCDAYDEPLFQGAKRLLLKFHRKIAPYKISFAVSNSNSSTIDDLSDLALYLSRKLRSNNVSVLLLPNAYKSSLESLWHQYDQMGIPFCVILNDNTLKNGITYLRSRDTTLKEQVHVSDLSDYVEKLFRNY